MMNNKQKKIVQIGNQFVGKEEYIKSIFQNIAPYYDVMNKIMTWGIVDRWRRLLLKRIPLRGEELVLDVCTGTGEIAFLLAEKLGMEGKVIGLDFSEEMLQCARRKAARLKHPEIVSFVRGDALKLPFPAETFDYVIMGFALRNITDILGAVKEMIRVCKKGGMIFCQDISCPENLLLKVGFNLYFTQFIPLLGRFVDKGEKLCNYLPAYRWLSVSLQDFPQGKEMIQHFVDAGLQEGNYFTMSGGIVTVYWGVKS